jgi:hypothetical protein
MANSGRPRFAGRSIAPQRRQSPTGALGVDQRNEHHRQVIDEPFASAGGLDIVGGRERHEFAGRLSRPLIAVVHAVNRHTTTVAPARWLARETEGMSISDTA